MSWKNMVNFPAIVLKLGTDLWISKLTNQKDRYMFPIIYISRTMGLLLQIMLGSTKGVYSTIRTCSLQVEPVFGYWAKWLKLYMTIEAKLETTLHFFQRSGYKIQENDSTRSWKLEIYILFNSSTQNKIWSGNFLETNIIFYHYWKLWFLIK